MNNEMFDDDEFDEFHTEVKKQQKYFALFGLLITFGGFLLVVLTIYFFLAALGFVPAFDLIPVIPYI